MRRDMKCQLIIAAAGKGVRLGHDMPKALVEIAGKPLLVHTLERFHPLGLTDNTIILITPEQRALFEKTLQQFYSPCPFTLIDGGMERQVSVCNGLNQLDPAVEIVIIHDAARPFVPENAIRDSIQAAAECGAATVAIPSTDTILEAEGISAPEHTWLYDTPDRRKLWACQTPQTFLVNVIRQAHAFARETGYLGTDDATLVRKMGGKVRLIMGSPLNLKVTTPADLALAECIVKEGLMP